MKTKFKNIFFSLLVAIALLCSANFPLAIGVVNTVNNLSLAEYKPTDFVTPYDFTNATGWTSHVVNDSDVKNKFTNSSIGKNISTLVASDTFDIKYKPATNYKDQSTDTSGANSDFSAMMIHANGAPLTSVVTETDEKGNTVYQKDSEGNWIYETNSDGSKKVISSKDKTGSADKYVLVDGTNDQYYVKVPSTKNEFVTYYYQTNTALTLKANSWYVVSFWVWTKDADATVMLTGTDFETKITANTNGAWKQYYKFIETSSDNTNSVNIRFYYGDNKCLVADQSEDVTPDNNTLPKTLTGVVFLDHLCVQTISETEYRNQTVGGETLDAESQTPKYSRRFDANFYNKADFNGNFESNLEVYEYMYGEDSYNKETANTKFQNYINKYTSDTSTDKLSDKQLANIQRAYEEKLSSSIVLESKEFETEEDVLDADKNPTYDGNGDKITEIVPAPNTFNPDNKILKIENKSEKYTLGLLSKPISVPQYSYLRVTLFTRTTAATESAVIKLISSIKTGDNVILDQNGDIVIDENSDGSMQIKSQTISAYKTESYNTNNWTEVTFYVQGSSYYDSTMQIALLADAESTAYYDEIRVEHIASTTYTNALSSKKFDLFPTSTSINGSITNGYFDFIETNNADPSKTEIPYTPASWIPVKDSSSDVISGIISTKDNFLNTLVKDADGNEITLSEKIGNPSNPISYTYGKNGEKIENPRTNVLVMYAPKEVDGKEVTHTFAYRNKDQNNKETTFSLSGNSVYQISFEVYADTNFDGSIYANLICKELNIAEFETEVELGSEAGWQKYTIVVRTGSSSRSVTLEYGIKDAVGTAFFQKIGYKKLAEKTVDDEKISVDQQYLDIESEYNTMDKQRENKIRFVNFDNNPFVMYSNSQVKDGETELGYYSSLSHSLKEAGKDEDPIEQGILGVIDTTKNLTLGNASFNLESSFLSNPVSNSSFAMFIYNDINYATQVNPNTQISLSSSSYYEISVYVKTKDIAEGKGLTINMDKISVKFNNINTEKDEYGNLDETNGYKKFTAIVKTGSSTISNFDITYSLGTSSNKTTGLALISNIQVNKLANEDAYNELIEKVDKNDTTTVIKDFSSKSTSTLDEDADNLTLATFFLVFSSLLLVAVLVFAIVSVYIRRVPKVQNASGNNKSSKKSGDNTPKDGFI